MSVSEEWLVADAVCANRSRRENSLVSGNLSGNFANTREPDRSHRPYSTDLARVSQSRVENSLKRGTGNKRESASAGPEPRTWRADRPAAIRNSIEDRWERQESLPIQRRQQCGKVAGHLGAHRAYAEIEYRRSTFKASARPGYPGRAEALKVVCTHSRPRQEIFLPWYKFDTTCGGRLARYPTLAYTYELV
jgi:hypothetical protein